MHPLAAAILAALLSFPAFYRDRETVDEREGRLVDIALEVADAVLTSGFKDWLAFMKKYYPAGSLGDQLNVYGYTMAQALVQTLKQCGDDLSRENIMKQAANLDIALPMLLPGIRIKTGPNDHYGIQAQRMMRFNGKTWELFGDLIGNN